MGETGFVNKHLIFAVIAGIIGIVLYYNYNFANEIEQTLGIIKPGFIDNIEDIQDIISKHGFTIVQSKKLHLTETQAKEFYHEHSHRSFYFGLVEYMISGPCVVMMLERSNAIKQWRSLMGPTDPSKAKQSHPDSIRALFGKSIQNNVVHGSDSQQSAQRELSFFFSDSD